MPGNIIQINHSKKLEWYVGDSKMDNLIEHLDKIGFRTSEEEDKENAQVNRPQKAANGGNDEQ